MLLEEEERKVLYSLSSYENSSNRVWDSEWWESEFEFHLRDGGEVDKGADGWIR